MEHNAEIDARRWAPGRPENTAGWVVDLYADVESCRARILLALAWWSIVEPQSRVTPPDNDH